MISLTMLVRDRYELTKQSLDSLVRNTPMDLDWTLAIVDDASQPETAELLKDYSAFNANIFVARNEQSQGTGAARNQVCDLSRGIFGKGDYLYLSDNDVYFKPGWLEALIEAFQAAEKHSFLLLGAYNHPFHHPIKRFPMVSKTLKKGIIIAEYYAVAMQSWLMRWKTYDKYGPFKQTPVGRVRESEDHEFCQLIREDRYRVGAVFPPLIQSTGAKDSFGADIPGNDLVLRELYEVKQEFPEIVW